MRSDEQESGTSNNDRESGSTVADDGSSPMMRDFDDRPSTSRDAYCGVCGELDEPEGSQSDSDCRENSSDGADVEGNPTPKSRKRVRRPRGWKKNVRIRLRNSGKDYTSAPGKKVLYCSLMLPLIDHCTTTMHTRLLPDRLTILLVAVPYVAVKSCRLRNGSIYLTGSGLPQTSTFRMLTCVVVSKFCK